MNGRTGAKGGKEGKLRPGGNLRREVKVVHREEDILEERRKVVEGREEEQVKGGKEEK